MSFLDWFSGLTGQMSADMAIDLGTANTLVAITGEGIVINEPSVVAIEKSTQRVLAVGHEAKNMINHTPDAFSAEHPLKDGVIADYDVTEAMISAFISKAAPRKYPWQAKPRIVICILMFCGACAGSTAGGLKISRVVIFLKAAKQDLNKMLHTHAVTTVRFEGKPLDEKVLRGVHNYFNIYMLLLTLSVLLLSLDGFDIVSTFTAVLTCFNNVGPGLEMVGPMGSFADFSAPAKLLLSFDMLAGRLELYPMLALFSPRLWRKRISSFKEAKV